MSPSTSVDRPTGPSLPWLESPHSISEIYCRILCMERPFLHLVELGSVTLSFHFSGGWFYHVVCTTKSSKARKRLQGCANKLAARLREMFSPATASPVPGRPCQAGESHFFMHNAVRKCYLIRSACPHTLCSVSHHRLLCERH